MMYFTRILSTIFCILYCFSALAKISVDITQGNVDDISISFSDTYSGYSHEKEIASEIIKVIKADLIRSGLFDIKKDVKLSLDKNAEPKSKDWYDIHSVSLVTTSANRVENDKVEIKYRLYDIPARKQLLGKSLRADKNNFRRIAHMISDSIYHRMTGEQGYFNSRIVYIAESNNTKKIAVMDQDGANRYFLTDGSNLVLTPRFSPESQRIVYMSYADETPTIYMRDIDTNTEELIGNFPGITSAPRFAPDGNSVLMARSLNGATDIYEVKVSNHKRNRLTSKSAINTSPSYSPDQKKIVFNSDRSGSPQLYMMNSDGKNQHRITFTKGRYSAPVWSPRGDWIAFSKVVDGEFYIGVIKADGSGERMLASGYLVESPTWSPNGRVIIYTKQVKGLNGKIGSHLYSIDLTGENERVIYTTTDASDPSWSPVLL